MITGFMFKAPVSGAADVFKVPGGDILIVFLGFWLGFLSLLSAVISAERTQMRCTEGRLKTGRVYYRII